MLSLALVKERVSVYRTVLSTEMDISSFLALVDEASEYYACCDNYEHDIGVVRDGVFRRRMMARMTMMMMMMMASVMVMMMNAALGVSYWDCVDVDSNDNDSYIQNANNYVCK